MNIPILGQEHEDKNYVQEACKAVQDLIPDGHGFILFTFPFEGQGDGMLRYASSAGRKTAVHAVKEWISHQEEETTEQGE